MQTLPRKIPATKNGSYSNDDQRWNAVVDRDVRSDGKFFYSVKTTRVYCRPICNARLAKRENVSFHDSCEAAERAGFRPCKRCQPNGKLLEEFHVSAVTKACRRIQESDNLPSLETLSKIAGMSAFHFHRIFKKITGLTPKAYAKTHRAEQLRAELPSRKTVTEAIYGAGFNSSGRFYAESPRMLGMKPKIFREGGKGTEIRFAIGECSLGTILVASTEIGICEISLGDDPSELVKKFQNRFPNAKLIGGDKKFERLVAKVVGFVEAPQLGLSLPIDVRGTAFQQRVWDALQKIPCGTSVSYSEIARRIGKPNAVRAVASAIASNNIAVAIPCHRVLHLDGSISGYRWGVERKRLLLKKEQGK